MGEPLPFPGAGSQLLRPLDAPRVVAPTSPAPASGWDLLLGCAAGYVVTGVGRVHELFPVLLPLKPGFVIAALGVTLYVLQQSGQRRVELLRSQTTTCLLGLILWVGLSVPGALNQGVAFDLLRGFTEIVLMYFVVAGSVRGVRDVERLMLAYFAATVVYTAVVLSRFQLSAETWRLGRLYTVGTTGYYDANDLATLIVTAMPLGLYFILGRRQWSLRLFALAGLAVLVVGQIRSGSRGGFLALLAVTAFVLLRFTTVPVRARVAGLALILGVVFAAASDQYWTQMQTLLNPRADYNTTVEGGRLKIWERGITYMVTHPVLGVGAKNFQVAEGTISPLARQQELGIGVVWGAAHNSFVQVGAELGIPGLLCFVGLIAGAFASLRRVARYALRAGPSAVGPLRLARSLTAALVGFVVGGFFLSLAFSDMLYTLVALAAGLEKTVRAEQAGTLRPRHNAPV
ncbi:MAG TPA: O-antigen ligase family protein [Gemmatimonadales bacterium]|nr:O-antigen ligase family protein [Gemmatimonadales bacterium]